jgi:dinuclear metal center YbgI/SA1388 family protein
VVFWNKSDYPIVGINYQRISKLIKHDLNLFAYHLPLDNHAEVGNNIQLAQLLGIMPRGQCDDQNLLWYGDLPQAIEFNELAALYYQQTGHQPRAVGAPGKIQQIAWCTGGADSMFNAAIELGVDCFITGEISEPVYHLAHESKVGFLAGGHYVTERYGIMALTEQLKHWGLNAEFIEIYNPI